MAVEKDKVLAVLEAKFKGKSLTKTFKENLAAKWAAKIENEDDIDSYVDDREEVVLEAAAEADRRATDATKKAAEKANEPSKKPDVDPKNDLPDDTPEYVKAIMKKLETVEGELNGFKTAQSQKSIAERFKSDERVKGIPEFMFKGRIPSTEEEFESAVTELATDYETYSKDLNITKFGNDKPGGASAKPKGGKEASKEEIDAIASKMNI